MNFTKKNKCYLNKVIKLPLFIIALSLMTSGQAQIWKKLQKKAGEAAERALERKVAEKTGKETSRAFDSVFNNQGRLFKKKKIAPEEYYQFSHKYVMQIYQEKDTTELVYYLTDQGQYMGNAVSIKQNEQMLTVLDLDRKAAFNFMDLHDNKSMMSFSLDHENITARSLENTKINIEPTGNSTQILGYNCEEYKVRGEHIRGRVWVTKEAEISFSNAFSKIKSKKGKSAEGINQDWMSMIDGLTLEMNMTDTSKKKHENIKMRCISLDRVDYIVYTEDYKKTY